TSIQLKVTGRKITATRPENRSVQTRGSVATPPGQARPSGRKPFVQLAQIFSSLLVKLIGGNVYPIEILKPFKPLAAPQPVLAGRELYRKSAVGNCPAAWRLGIASCRARWVKFRCTASPANREGPRGLDRTCRSAAVLPPRDRRKGVAVVAISNRWFRRFDF